MEPAAYIFYGRSGAGKGTQAKLLKQHLEGMNQREVIYIETGKGFREFVGSEADTNYTARLTKAVMDSGGVLPAFLPVWVWTARLIEKFTGNEHLILDGLARKIHEAPVLHNALEFYGMLPRTYVVFINTSREWSKQRLLERGRADDHDAEIEKRLDWFDSDALPAMEYFKNIGDITFVDVNGEGTIEEVQERVRAGVGLN